MRHTLDLEVVRLDSNRVVVTVSGELDAHSCAEMRSLCAALVEHGCTHLVIDASRVAFIDSAGLGVLVGVMKRAEAHAGGCFELRTPSRAVRHALTTTGLTGLLHERGRGTDDDHIVIRPVG